MLSNGNNYAWLNKGANNPDGRDISKASINKADTLSKWFTSSNGWTVANGRLPGLFGQTVEMPEHLRTSPTGIEQLQITNDELQIYPNPTHGQLRITDYEPSMGEIEIYDVVGKKLLNYQIIDDLIDISHLSAGLYILKTGNKITKIIKE
jgi:hypothetical protein